MEPLRIRTAPEQLAEYLKEGIRAGRWTDRMPGEDWMMTHLQVGRDTVRVAWTLLEKEGPGFAWNNPVPSHIQWDYRPVVRSVVRWAKNVADGKEDSRKFGTEAKFIEGGTIGPVPGMVGGE